MQANPPPRWQRITGIVLSILPAAMLVMSGVMKISANPEMVAESAKGGVTESMLLRIGITELTCVVLFLVPPTAALGAILISAFMGGAVFAHVLKGDPFIIPVAVSVLAWAGLWLRDPRLRALLPIRR